MNADRTDGETERCKVPGCGGAIIVHHSQRMKNHRRQYMRCNKCGAKHGAKNVPHTIESRIEQLEARLKNLEQSLCQRNSIGSGL